ncbi:JHL06P13.13 [Artemisia annua]|uniref:JHL06P13.13 n=1 Tax=Artemisia annua TaxID=35608 RepID=A0A2U1LYL2_ARTAN|nr:JHL06P13.13 [Artemisia annua]
MLQLCRPRPMVTFEWIVMAGLIKCDGVGVARLLNATLVLPKFEVAAYWNESSGFTDKQPQVEGPKCGACFQILDSPVQALQYVDHGAKLAVAMNVVVLQCLI